MTFSDDRDPHFKAGISQLLSTSEIACDQSARHQSEKSKDSSRVRKHATSRRTSSTELSATDASKPTHQAHPSASPSTLSVSFSRDTNGLAISVLVKLSDLLIANFFESRVISSSTGSASSSIKVSIYDHYIPLFNNNGTSEESTRYGFVKMTPAVGGHIRSMGSPNSSRASSSDIHTSINGYFVPLMQENESIGYDVVMMVPLGNNALNVFAPEKYLVPLIQCRSVTLNPISPPQMTSSTNQGIPQINLHRSSPPSEQPLMDDHKGTDVTMQSNTDAAAVYKRMLKKRRQYLLNPIHSYMWDHIKTPNILRRRGRHPPVTVMSFGSIENAKKHLSESAEQRAMCTYQYIREENGGENCTLSAKEISRIARVKLDARYDFICFRKGCGRCFSRTEKLVKHIMKSSDIHCGNPWHCPYLDCTESYVVKQDLAEHINEHEERGEPKLPFPYAWNCPYPRVVELILAKKASSSGNEGVIDCDVEMEE
ncbi:hypothetical protein M422DRAFT_241884 [Sphaerobolus stellatus SS14]|nr:hypothetical protein M422DRAFT_241884 [Sphaerobolus stellatus SS14]